VGSTGRGRAGHLRLLPAGAEARANLFVTNLDAGTISEVTPGGVVSTFASGSTARPALAFDDAGNLFVANLGAGTISEVTPAGVVSTFVSGFNSPTGLAFDDAGNLFVANSGARHDQQGDAGGVVSTFASGVQRRARPGIRPQPETSS